MEREEETIFQLPKASTMIKRSLAMGINKIKKMNTNVDQPDQINESQEKLIKNILEESNLTNSNNDTIGLEEILREYEN